MCYRATFRRKQIAAWYVCLVWKCSFIKIYTVVDPGFPKGGGADPVGGAKVQHGDIAENYYVKTKDA